MMKKYLLNTLMGAACLLSPLLVEAADCTIKYNLKGWSAFYKTAQGTGVVSCSNGKSQAVKLTLKGGGFTFGSLSIVNGKGRVIGASKIQDVYGGYFAIDGHAGFNKSVEARALLFKPVSLSMSGKGTGYNLGWSMGSLKISPK